MQVDLSLPVAHLAARRPAAWAVLRRHGIDGRGGTLAEACDAAGISAAALAAEIVEAEAQLAASAPASVLGLMDFLAGRRAALAEELPRLTRRARGSVAGFERERLAQVRETLALLADELEAHVEKEEGVLYPWFRTGRGATASGPVQVMEREHDQLMARLRDLRRLAFDYRAAGSFWRGLEAFERALVEHVHVENNVLFPLVLAGGAGP